MTHVVVTDIERADAATAAAFAEFGSATAHEALGRTGYAGSQIRPIQQGAAISGTAITVRLPPGDNLMVHAAIEQAREGDVIVVVPTDGPAHGVIGELMATQMQVRGVRAYVTSGGVRDTEELRRMGFAVWTAHVSAEGTVKQAAGSVNVPVMLGSAHVHPGDIVVADDDGVTIVPRDRAAATLTAARERADREKANRARYRDGEISMDINRLRSVLDQAGVRYVTQTEHDGAGR
ncbi:MULTISPECIES: 4-carboxy-4-hydroxy-2-oxoadipate aldolase/oxaloacetate decarboxylase [unclassified Microbacterium]|uniref:4-carboxy-4-hydroxy-2-oxoadipate aldolase/oxaloacetate decarboxylase n=1 Tax=unclassified Microbacterium TaxID=2609290 RepID=UPI00214CEB8C|nr:MULTISPECIES: 4-carboxy-4-hydroxy-2-oxoadipate aldolase/oxaloacetate decarboxylase [unclassified Microbacterium]MCR2800286.1 4-carboxy-4-hydroxy-2-oxoadipate aldolase/oxaloacetate decarboxylase [Microbacterium sp. zg.Y818]MCR2824323.1 4-carboxy-4-hydroxy-2-oxoadipate aldolase/oxaloacetate decarboxylase [Microbacterium sp. zg.Y909]WIM22248.1 4-carboxy-4-hydroxy-2-oxoadipate aldolase/oxaloacetate decarboxylase [Microbacterium sp. zg-Y818]